MELSGLLNYCILFYCIIHAVLCQNTDERYRDIQDKEIGHVNQISMKGYIFSLQQSEIFHVVDKMIVQLDWMCLSGLLLIPNEISPGLEHVYDRANAVYGISIEHIIVRHMVIAKIYKKVINETVDFPVYESMQVDSSFIVVLANVLGSYEITWYSATQQITRCMHLSKLQQFHQLREIFDVKLRLICLQEDLEKPMEYIHFIIFQQNDQFIGYTPIISMCTGSNNAIFSKLTFDHFCYIWVMNGPCNGAMANVFTTQSMKSTWIYSFYRWEQNNLVTGGGNRGVIISLDTEFLHCIAQQKPSMNLLLSSLQSVTVTAGNTSHLMNTFTEHDDRISLDDNEYNMEHNSYQDMHLWHTLLVCISLDGTENFQIYAWKVNRTTNIMKSLFIMKSQNLIACKSEKERFQTTGSLSSNLFPDYTRRHNISNGYQISCSFFKGKDRRFKSSGLFARPVITKFKLGNTTGWPNMDPRITNDTNHVCSEQELVFSLSKMFMIAIYDSYNVFMILSLCFQEKLITSNLSKDKCVKNEENVTLNKPMCINTRITDLAKPLQFIWVMIFDSSSYLLNQYNKTSLLFISPVSLYALKLKWYYFQKQFSSIGVYSTFTSMQKEGNFQLNNLNQIYTLSNLTNNSLFDIIRPKEKDTIFTLLLSDQNHIPMYCCAVPFQRSFVVIFTKSHVDNFLLRKIWNISTVNSVLCLNNHTDLLNQLHLAYESSSEMFVLNKFFVYFGSFTDRNKCFRCTFDHTITSTSTKNDEILHRRIKQPCYKKHASIFIGHGNAIKRSLLCLHMPYLFNIITNVCLLSLFFIALLFPLMTFLSGLFFKWSEKLLHFLYSLSVKLDQTLWPWGIIQFLYKSLSKIHFLLAVYFEAEIFSHFYEITAHAKTTPYVDHKNNRHCNFSVYPDLAKKVFKAILCCFKCIFIEHEYKQPLQKLCTILSRLLLPGKLISDIPEETEAIKCTDDAQCDAIKVLNFNMPLTNYSELTSENAEAARLEINKLPDTIMPLNYQNYNTGFCGENSEEARLEMLSSRASDAPNSNSSDAKHLLFPLQPTSSNNIHLLAKVATSNSSSTQFDENFQSDQPQLTQSVTNKQKVSKYHSYSIAVHTAKKSLIHKMLDCHINLELFIALGVLTALCFGVYKSNSDTTEISKCKCDLRSQDFKWNKCLLLIEYSLLNYESSKIVNYQRIRSDFQFLNLSKVFLDYILHDLLGHTLFVVCTFQLIMEMFCDMQQYNHSKYQKSLLDTFQTMLRCNYIETNDIKTSIECTGFHTCSHTLPISVLRSTGKKKAKQELNSKFNQSQTEVSVPLGSSDQPKAKSIAEGSAYLPTTTAGLQAESKAVDTKTYSIDKLPGATASHDKHYEIDFGENIPISREETRKNVRPVPKEKDVDSLIQPYQKNQITATATGNVSPHFVQDKVKSPAQTVPSSSVNKSHRSLPRRACLVHLKEQYNIDNNLLSQPRATKYLVKVRTEISPGRYMAKLELQCSSKDDRLPNLDATQQVADTENNEQIDVPTRERKHFHANINKIGHVIFSSNLDCFSGSIQYPLPNKKAVASRIGYGGNAIVFVVFYAGKEFAVKKTVYRSKEISVHSQLCHPNIINLEAVLIGEKHERHKDKHYVYCFMPKMDINFRNVLSTKEHGCLKHMKMQLLEKREQWEVVLVNVKHVLRSVLKAMDYMHSQGLVHRDIKASNILIKMTCQCTDVLYCNCQRRKFLVQIGDFDSSATVPGYQLQLEEHQMIRYASVLPLGTMGYRAPEVSMHLVLSGPYEILYTTGVDIWSFGCLLLTIFIGKSGPLKQRGEASLLLSAQDYPYSQDLYHKIIKIKEVKKYYANITGVCDLVQKCLQVQPHCRPTAKELLQLDFFTDTA